jgi:hypothetical protein
MSRVSDLHSISSWIRIRIASSNPEMGKSAHMRIIPVVKTEELRNTQVLVQSRVKNF